MYGQDEVPWRADGNVVKVAVDHGCCVAAKSDGSPVSWGLVRAEAGYLVPPRPPEDLRSVAHVAITDDFCVALKTDGALVGWGPDEFGTFVVPVDLTDVVDVAGGGGRFFALARDGTVRAWGS